MPAGILLPGSHPRLPWSPLSSSYAYKLSKPTPTSNMGELPNSASRREGRSSTGVHHTDGGLSTTPPYPPPGGQLPSCRALRCCT